MAKEFKAGQEMTAGDIALFRDRVRQGLDPLTGKAPKKEAPAPKAKAKA